MNVHHFTFFFALPENEPTNRVIIAPKELKRVQEFKHFNMLCNIIIANRFLLEQSHFDLLRLKFEDGKVIISRHSFSVPYKLDFVYYVS